MASVVTKLSRNLRLFSLYNNGFAVKSIKRSLFSPAAIGIDKFQDAKTNIESDKSNNRENLKKSIIERINTDKQIFTADLKTYIFLVKTDDELDLLRKALEKYQEINKDVGTTEYEFGPQLMRLCYILNKADLAIEMFFDEKLKSAFSSSTSLLILMNKLNEDKRYEDTIKLFDRVLELPNYFLNPKSNAFQIPQDIIKLTVEAYYYSNNSTEAMNKLKNLMSKINPTQKVNGTSIVQAFCLSIKQKDYDYALELTSKLNNGGLQYNMKAIVFAQLNRFNDSFEQIQNILGLEYPKDENGGSRDVFVYPSTLKYIRDAIEAKNDNESLKKFEELSNSVFQVKRLSRRDLTDIFTRVIMIRGNVNKDGAGIGGQRFNRLNDGYQERQPFRPLSDRQGFRPREFNPDGRPPFQQQGSRPREFNPDGRPQFQQQGFRPREFNPDGRPQFQQQNFRNRSFNQDRPQSDRFQQQNRSRREVEDDE